ncbi:histidine phosphatase family protein [uncultured Sulfitobacter sp.]|uniref:histidine phosphatase family protein n=1 Tax=uncultured Sulfitobacter sp. TaxID=191468 RepID=UPI0026295223|nr:histidine phosphatase family protein [uncultured Sulfitobacter sp.]
MSNEARQHKFVLRPNACELVLIRHGETQAAKRGEMFPMINGQGDPALRPEGEAQAAAVAARLRHEAIKAIYVTTMQRTHQTAAPLAQALGMTPKVEADLREVFLGEWDGGEFRFRAAENDPAFLRAREKECWGELPGAETFAALQARVVRGLTRIADAHLGESVAVVVHGGVVGAALSYVTGSRNFGFNGADNGSISRIVMGPEGNILRGFNDVAHL